MGSFCIWWSYDIYTHPGQCDMGHRLTSLILKEACKKMDYRLAAMLPIIVFAIIFMLYKSNENDT